MRTLHGYKSGTVGKKRDLAVFWYEIEKKSVKVRAPQSKFTIWMEKFAAYGRLAKGPSVNFRIC